MGSDVENVAMGPEELAKKKKIKLITYVVIFIIFQVIVFAVLGTTVLRVKRPNIKIRSVNIENWNVDAAAPSFDMRLNTVVTVKNKNWGEYKFRNSTMTLSYRGETVGEAQIPARKVNLRGTRRMNIAIDVNSNRLSSTSNLVSDLNSGSLTLNAYTKLNGKVTLMLLMKKSKSGQMNCTIIINPPSQAVQEITCK